MSSSQPSQKPSTRLAIVSVDVLKSCDWASAFSLARWLLETPVDLDMSSLRIALRASAAAQKALDKAQRALEEGDDSDGAYVEEAQMLRRRRRRRRVPASRPPPPRPRHRILGPESQSSVRTLRIFRVGKGRFAGVRAFGGLFAHRAAAGLCLG